MDGVSEEVAVAAWEENILTGHQSASFLGKTHDVFPLSLSAKEKGKTQDTHQSHPKEEEEEEQKGEAQLCFESHAFTNFFLKEYGSEGRRRRRKRKEAVLVPEIFMDDM